jgi:hypothetical protein
VQDLERSTETTSELLDRISYYQTKYDELREFTYNEKKIYEESITIQVQVPKLQVKE